jgi:hypothetical protein
VADQVLSTSAQAWAQLDAHFRAHATLVRRFQHIGASAVIDMWRAGCNEFGQPLSAFERQALVERYCELFGRWPV